MECSHCGKAMSDPPKLLCSHLLAPGADYETHHRLFTGRGTVYSLICEVCARAGAAAVPLREVCEDCFARHERFWAEGRPIGHPQVLIRSTDLVFSHRTITVSDPPTGPWLSVQPISGASTSIWIGLAANGALFRIDVDQAGMELLTCLRTDEVDVGQPISLHVDGSGRYAAVANTLDRYGVVLDLATGARTMTLQRGDYYPEHCKFPLAFFAHEGRTLLVHATDWNRLEVSDPATGTLLTARDDVVWQAGEPAPAHTLDYFHSDLHVSPDQRWIADNGWIWHPYGSVVTWSLAEWMDRNVWESEDGPSLRELCSRQHFWNGPLCWLGPATLAVWGFGDDEEHLMPAVRIFDVTTGRQLKWFAGPQGTLVFDQVLFSFSPEGGTSVWDVATGERLLSDPSFCPTAYHPGARQFLTLLEDGRFRMSHLVGVPTK